MARLSVGSKLEAARGAKRTASLEPSSVKDACFLDRKLANLGTDFFASCCWRSMRLHRNPDSEGILTYF